MNKIHPQAIDMEEAVLGALLNESEASLEVTFLRAECFYKEAHKRIFKVIQSLTLKSAPVDIFTVTEELRKINELENIGGPLYLSNLTSKVFTAAHIGYHARIVHQKYMQREIIRISTELQNRAFDDSNDVSELFEYAECELLKITGQIQNKEAVKLGKVIDLVLDKILKIQNREIELIGQPSGFTGMDRKTGGFKDGELVIIAGRPSMGKSALALQIAINAATRNRPVALFSLEMSDESLAQRTISGLSGKTNVQLMEGSCDVQELYKQTAESLNLPVYIDDSGTLTIMELRAKTRKLILKYGIKMLIVDYLQLMEGAGQSREQEVSKVSRGLKAISKEFSIPVIALSQLSRKCEERADKRPMLSDLRESGAIEQDADVVGFVYRPAYYRIATCQIDSSEVSSEGVIEFIIAKNRNGATGSYFLQHNIALTEITEYEKLGF